MDERSMTPAWMTIVGEQFRLAGLRFRVAGASLMALGVLIVTFFVWFLNKAGTGLIASREIALANHALSAHARAKLAIPLAPMDWIFAPEMSTILLPLALLLPLGMWQDEPPTQRGYHLTMPVRSSTHTLLRVLAGWFWMMAITALLLVAFVTIPVIATRVPGALPVQLRYMAWWEWLVPFTAVTVAYLFASAAAVGARRPFVWVAGIPILYMGIGILLLLLQKREAAATLQKGVSGFYGAFAALAGQVSWTAGAPSLSRWLGATAIWGLVGAALLHSLAHRRAEA